MMSVKALLRDIRFAIHDTQCVNYEDREILKTINAGLRLIRRTIADLQPEFLMSTATGILRTGEDTIQLKNNIMKIVEVTAGDEVISSVQGRSNKAIYSNFNKIYGNSTKNYSKYELKTFKEKKLTETNLQHIEDKSLIGTPKYFYRAGIKTIKLYPIPKVETAYTVRTVDDIEDLRMEDKTPILNEFDDFLFEYCVMRLSLENEYDMTQEQALVQSMHQQIAQVLSPPPAGVRTRGYW